MAQVTMELRKVLTLQNFNLFDFDYPCDDAAWKERLEQQFIDTYYFNEIGMETIDRWKHYVRTKFQTIMPYYNELYKTTLIEINPLITRRLSETYEETGNDNLTAAGSDNSSVNTQAEDNAKNFDYPQNANPLTDIASGATVNDSSSTTGSSSESQSTSSVNRLKDYQRVIEGLEGNQAELMKSYRDNILRINSMIMKECKDLFILVY